MLELVKSCCCEQQIPTLYKSSNSYFIYLSILARMMKEETENSGVHPWKQIKGRYGCYLVSHIVKDLVSQTVWPLQPRTKARGLYCAHETIKGMRDPR